MSNKKITESLGPLKSFYVLNVLKEAKKLGIKTLFIDQVGKKFYFRLSYKNKHIYLINSSLHKNLNNVSSLLAEDKNFTKIVLDKAGIKTPQGFAVTKFSEIKPGLKKHKIKLPIVLKPNNLLESIGVMVDLDNWTEVKEAFSQIQEIIKNKKDKLVLVEECFPVRNFRLLVLDGKFIACTERTRPQVTGDGKKNIKQLVDQKFKGEKTVFSRIDWEMKMTLKKQGVSPVTVLGKGRVINLRPKQGLYFGGLAVNHTSKTCPKFKKIAEGCAASLNLRLAGIDIMTSDISDPQADYRVLEVNQNPECALLHDKPSIGKSEQVIKKILKAIFNIK